MPMIRTFSTPLGSWTWIVSPSTTSTTVPARSSGVGAAVGDGARVGESEGAIVGERRVAAVALSTPGLTCA
jgi:hypothetical protein